MNITLDCRLAFYAQSNVGGITRNARNNASTESVK